VIVLGLVMGLVAVSQCWDAAQAWSRLPAPPPAGSRGVGNWIPGTFFAFATVALVIGGALLVAFRPRQSGAAWARLSPSERGRFLREALEARAQVLSFGWWFALLLFGGYTICSAPFWWADVRAGRLDPWMPALLAALALWVCAHLTLGWPTTFVPALRNLKAKQRWVVRERGPWIELFVLLAGPWIVWSGFDKIHSATFEEVIELYGLVLITLYAIFEIGARLMRLFKGGRCTVILERGKGEQHVDAIVKRLPEWLLAGSSDKHVTAEIRILAEGGEERRLGPMLVQVKGTGRTGVFTLPAALLRECAAATGVNLSYRLWFSVQGASKEQGEWAPLPPATVHEVADESR
jgi:hypothetical protein